jgi:hypothetical protein
MWSMRARMKARNSGSASFFDGSPDTVLATMLSDREGFGLQRLQTALHGLLEHPLKAC